jgi:ATPase subunit of ABC transporter with duplicated ATPase domains
MGHVGCSNLAYAHPGGDLLFDGVSFMVGAGEHAGLVGANGVGKTTLLKLLARELSPEDGEITTGGRLAYMAQDVGAAGETRTVRELLVTLAPAAIRTAGERIAAAEKRLAAGDDAAGVELGTAIGEWSELGG